MGLNLAWRWYPSARKSSPGVPADARAPPESRLGEVRRKALIVGRWPGARCQRRTMGQNEGI